MSTPLDLPPDQHDDETAPTETGMEVDARGHAFSRRRTHLGSSASDGGASSLSWFKLREMSEDEAFMEALLVAAGNDHTCFWNIVSWMFSSEMEMPVIRKKATGRGIPGHLRSEREMYAQGTGLEDLSAHRRRLLQDFVLGLCAIAWYQPGSDDEVVIATNGDFARAGLPDELPKTIYVALSDIARFGRYVGNPSYLRGAIEVVEAEAAKAEKAAEERRLGELRDEMIHQTRDDSLRVAAAKITARGAGPISKNTVARERLRLGL
jgi:hypothetical protein